MEEQYNDPFHAENAGYDSSFAPTTGSPPANIGAGDNGNPPVSFDYISIHDPELRGTNRFNSYHTYRVTTVPAVADNVYRRYSDFAWLADILSSTYPGVFVPPLPPKKAFGNKSEEFLIAQRRPGLERFLNRILRIPVLADSAAFQMFVSRTHTFEDGQAQVKKDFANRTSALPFAAYQYYYGETMAQPLPPTAEVDIIAMNEFLKQEEARLQELSELSHDIVEIQAKKTSVLGKLSSAMTVLTATEREYANLPPVQRVDIVDNLAQWHADVKEAEPVYTHHFHHQFVNELHDVKVMLSLLADREKAKSKYDKSKAKAAKWALPSTKCDTEKHRSQRELDLKAEEEDCLMADTLTKLVLLEQFKWMWEQRVGEYNNQVVAFAQNMSTQGQKNAQNFDNVSKPE